MPKPPKIFDATQKSARVLAPPNHRSACNQGGWGGGERDTCGACWQAVNGFGDASRGIPGVLGPGMIDIRPHKASPPAPSGWSGQPTAQKCRLWSFLNPCNHAWLQIPIAGIESTWLGLLIPEIKSRIRHAGAKF